MSHDPALPRHLAARILRTETNAIYDLGAMDISEQIEDETALLSSGDADQLIAAVRKEIDAVDISFGWPEDVQRLASTTPDALTPQRLTEIQDAHQQDHERGTVVPSQVPDIVAHRAELLAEVGRLNARVTELIERVGEAKGESHERLLRIAELEAASEVTP